VMMQENAKGCAGACMRAQPRAAAHIQNVLVVSCESSGLLLHSRQLT
jgi:hypothetical protein